MQRFVFGVVYLTIGAIQEKNCLFVLVRLDTTSAMSMVWADVVVPPSFPGRENCADGRCGARFVVLFPN